MATEVRGAGGAAPLALAAALLLSATPAHTQVKIDALTQVRSIGFEGVKSLHERRLRDLMATRDRGSFYGLRVAVGKLPFVPDPEPHLFSPLELQQDVVRIRNAYAAAGYVQADVRYRVERDDARNLLDLTMVVSEGRPIRMVEVVVTGPDSLTPLPVPEGEAKAWARMERAVLKQRGRILDVDQARDARDDLEKWWLDRGHPRAVVVPRFVADTAAGEGRLAYRVVPGKAAKIGAIRVEGGHRLTEDVVRRQIRMERGDPFSASELDKARLALQELDIIRAADVSVPGLTLHAGEPVAVRGDSAGAAAPPDSAARAGPASNDAGTPAAGPASMDPGTADTTVDVRVKVMEADPRLVSGDLGYVTDGGLSTEARWTHRYFSGGGRSLTVSGLAQTGWLAVTEDVDIRYRLGVSLKQPSMGLRYTSGVLTPFVEYRDDTQDRSTQLGLNTTLVYRVRQLRSISLDYQIASRDVHEYHFEDLATGEIDLLTFLTQAAQGQLDSLGSTLQTSAFTLSANLGRLDDPANPRRGWVIRPAVQTTAPTSISSTAYWRVDMAANAYLPLGRFAVLAARGSIGRLRPFGKSLPSGADDPQTKFLQLREASFTAGGTGDARGWENRLLGPKVPDVRFETVGDSLVPEADGYVPLGGFARSSFSLELQVPLAGVIRNLGSHFFIDGGRVWTEDARFGMEGDPYEQERLFYATGAGLDVRTPVGPIKVSVGYKLNPSITDLVDADDLLVAVNSGQGTDGLHRKNSRRWQWHLAIGTSY